MRARTPEDIEPHIRVFPMGIGIGTRNGAIMQSIEGSIKPWHSDTRYFSVERRVRGDERTVRKKQLGQYAVLRAGNTWVVAVAIESKQDKHEVGYVQEPDSLTGKPPYRTLARAVIDIVNDVPAPLDSPWDTLVVLHAATGISWSQGEDGRDTRNNIDEIIRKSAQASSDLSDGMVGRLR